MKAEKRRQTHPKLKYQSDAVARLPQDTVRRLEYYCRTSYGHAKPKQCLIQVLEDRS